MRCLGIDIFLSVFTPLEIGSALKYAWDYTLRSVSVNDR